MALVSASGSLSPLSQSSCTISCQPVGMAARPSLGRGKGWHPRGLAPRKAQQRARHNRTAGVDPRESAREVLFADSGGGPPIHNRRGRSSTPLTREEIVELNRLLLGVSFKIPELHSPAFLDSLPTASPPAPAAAATPRLVEEAVYVDLQRHLIALSGLEPQARGYAFEEFLSKAFAAFGLAPRSGFRNTGEQIDGSFVLHYHTYLVEAKWQNSKTDAADLRAFAGKVRDKVAWSRGVFISNSGFTDVGPKPLDEGTGNLHRRSRSL